MGSRLIAVAAVSLLAFEAPQAQSGVIRHDRDDSLYTALAALPEYAAVGYVDIVNPGGFGSGTLISSRWVLTAGHVVAPQPAEDFFVGGETYPAAASILHPNYNSAIGTGFDIGLFRVASPITMVAPAIRYAGADDVGQTVTLAGFGTTGNGQTGVQAGSGGTKRAGPNVADLAGNNFSHPAITFPISVNYLMADFDNPNNAGDNRMGTATPLDREYLGAPGDSGGGWFIGSGAAARLVGVHSFGLFVDGAPSNSDYGDMSAFMRVALFNDWIDDNIAAEWSNAAGGSANAAGNWQGGFLPDQTDILEFDAVTPGGNVVFTGANVYDKLLVRRGTIFFNFGGQTQTFDSPMLNGSVVVGRNSGDSATAVITNGNLASVDAQLGRDSGSYGVVQLGFFQPVNPPVQWTLSDSLYLGGSSTARGGSGGVTVNPGTSVHVGGALKLWEFGSVSLTGGDVRARTMDFGGGEIYNNAGGSLTVTGDDTQWSGPAPAAGAVVVNIGPGAEFLLTGNTIKAFNAGTTINNYGTATWVDGSILARGNTPILFNNQAGAVFEAQSTAFLAPAPSSFVDHEFHNAGTFRKSTSFTTHIRWAFTNSGVVEVNAGDLNFESGYTHNGGTIRLGGGMFALQPKTSIDLTSGAVEGHGILRAHLLNRTVVTAAASAEGLTIDGAYTQISIGALVVELASATNFGRLIVSPGHTLTLGGTLDVDLIDDFMPQEGNAFDILDWSGSLTGVFSTIELPELFGSLAWDSSQLYASGVLSVIDTASGDFGGDGVVDGGDLALWQGGFGMSGSATALQGDADGDGDSDGADFLVWQRQRNGTSARAVPEPEALLLTALGLALPGRLWRRNRRAERRDC